MGQQIVYGTFLGLFFGNSTRVKLAKQRRLGASAQANLWMQEGKCVVRALLRHKLKFASAGKSQGEKVGSVPSSVFSTKEADIPLR